MRILIGCETSGEMRRALQAKGHEVFSCDLLPADDGAENHIIDDVRNVITMGWDMAIFHPPCTRLCNSGVRWLSSPPKNKTIRQMWTELQEGAELFSACWNAPIAKVAVENPVMHKYAKERIVNYEPPAQTVQPWWFGDRAFKATSFYLRGLSPLSPTNKLMPPLRGDPDHKEWSAVHLASPGPDRWKTRSKTFPGIAKAAADQWG